MKARYIVFILLLLAVAAGGFVTVRYLIPRSSGGVFATSTHHPADLKDNDIVYVAMKGEDTHYHRGGCTMLKTGGRPRKFKDVLADGYKPCPVCCK